MSRLHCGQPIFIVAQINDLDLVKQVHFVLTFVSTMDLFLCAWVDDVVLEAYLRRAVKANYFAGLTVKIRS